MDVKESVGPKGFQESLEWSRDEQRRKPSLRVSLSKRDESILCPTWVVENRETAYDPANIGIREMPE